jgi:hypothetical protein
LSGFGGGGVGMLLDPLAPQVAAPVWPSAVGGSGAPGAATWGAPGAISSSASWASLAATTSAGDLLAAAPPPLPAHRHHHNHQQIAQWPGDERGFGQSALAMLKNNVDSNSETVKSEGSSDVEVQDLLSLLTCQ